MHDINPEALNFRQVALAALIAMGLVGAAHLLSGCSTTPQAPLPSYAEVAAPAPTPSAPKITGADILARQPKEVQDALQHYQEGAWPTYRNAHGMLVPYTERMDPAQIDCAPNYHVDIYLLPGETPTGVAAGDSERWVTTLATRTEDVEDSLLPGESARERSIGFQHSRQNFARGGFSLPRGPQRRVKGRGTFDTELGGVRIVEAAF